jgi:hypothetical protein
VGVTDSDPNRLSAMVKQAIDEADPIGLLAIGCPDDEYDPEIKRVLIYVSSYTDPDSLAQRIHQTFVEMFDEHIAGSPEVYQSIAQQIHKKRTEGTF